MQCAEHHNFLHKKNPYLHALQENREMSARYLDPKYSRWLSIDPALGEYMSGSDAGCGGIYNSVNLSYRDKHPSESSIFIYAETVYSLQIIFRSN